jgi:SAM-dependent methyltransferase
MTSGSRHDAWSAGSSYDAYMGRWSRQVAARFLDWIAPAAGLDWLEVGCGTGALTAAIIGTREPARVVGVEPSAGFIARAKENVVDARADFRLGDAQALPVDDADSDIVVSALVLNFVPDRMKALSEMKRAIRPGGAIAFYVWDYPGGGLEFIRAFWNVATVLDQGAAELTEDRRFPFCTQAGLTELAAVAGLSGIEATAIEIPTRFANFDDFWHPFTLGAGPAPGYCMSLTPDARQLLHDRLEASVPRGSDGSIMLKARAWAIKAVRP